MARRSVALPTKLRAAPSIDADSDSLDPMADDEDIIGGVFGIEYRDSKGEVSTRDIVVRAVAWRSHKLQVAAHCLLRDSYRCFLAQNIVTLAHGRTGEVIADPVAFFSALAPELPDGGEPAPRPKTTREGFAHPPRLSVTRMRKELRDMVRPAAVLLMAMARADEKLTPEEVAVIGDLVFEGARKTHTFQHTDMLVEMVQEMTALEPTSNMITRALNVTLDRGAFPPDLPQWLSRMAKADGEVSPGENDAYRQIIATLRRLVTARDEA